MDLQETIRQAMKIDGWLSIFEGRTLFKLAKDCDKGVIVDLGSWRGRSTIFLASGSAAGHSKKVYSIDSHKREDSSLQALKTNLERLGFGRTVKIVVEESGEAAKSFRKPVGLIFIDAEHDYISVKRDFDLWFPNVVAGGMMAFHDTIGCKGPRRLVKEKVFLSRNFRKARFSGSITYAEKVQENSLHDQIRNRYVFLLKHIYEFGTWIPLPSTLKRCCRRFLNIIQ